MKQIVIRVDEKTKIIIYGDKDLTWKFVLSKYDELRKIKRYDLSDAIRKFMNENGWKIQDGTDYTLCYENIEINKKD